MEYTKGECGCYADLAANGKPIILKCPLCKAAPLGYELAEMVLAQKADGLDRSQAIYEKAFDFMFKAEGK